MAELDPNRLPNTVEPRHYDLRLAPDLDRATFDGEQSVDITIHEPVDRITLHAVDLDVSAAWLERDGSRIDATVTLDPVTETAHLDLVSPAEAGEWTFRSNFSGELNDKLVGFYRSTFVDSDGETRTIACTQFESTHARRAFPCWDEPAFKASFTVTLDVPDDLLAVSNAAEVSSEPIGDGRRRVRFAPTMVMSTYLVAFVVGPLEATEPVDVDGVPLRVIAPPSGRDLTGFALEVGAFSLRFLAEWYDIDYPGDKLDLVAIPDFSFGAMENLGCVTFRETALLVDPARATQAEQQRVADVIAHEIAHMWFGDLVTMGWWNGIWLNEAFATFMEMLTTDAYRPEWQRWTDFGSARSAAFDTDSLTSTRAIEYEVVTAEDAEGMFDVLTYEKGASVVRMLQQYLGEERFQAGIRGYLRTHAFGNTETTDLWDAIEEASGEPVRQIMDSWIFRPGHPVVSIRRTSEGSDSNPSLTLSQNRFGFRPDPAAGLHPATEDPRHVPVVLRVGDDRGGTTVRRLLLREASTTLELDRSAAWVLGNHEGNGFYRVRLDDRDLTAVGTVGLQHLSPLERYGLVEDEWALLLADLSTVDRVLRLVRSMSADEDLSVWQRMVGVIGGLNRLAGDAVRPDLEAWTRALIAPTLLRLGSAPSDGEPDRVTALRASLFAASVTLGDDLTQRQQAERWFAELGDRPDVVDAELADAAVRAVASGADEEQWEELRRRASVAETPQGRLRHQGALADTSRVDLVMRFCDLVLTDEIRTQDGLFLVRRALANRHASSEVWDWITDNWGQLTTRFPSASVPRMLDGIRTISDRQLAERVVAFLDEHPVPQGAQVIEQHRERMWVTVALAERVPAALSAFLGES